MLNCLWNRLLFAALVLSPSGLAWPQSTATTERRPIEFNRDIRPILSDRCFRCHGPDAAERQADLRLDLEESAIQRPGGDAVIVRSIPDASELMHRIASSDPDQRMPPAELGKPLSEEQIELFRRWIAEGAAWQPHWSLVPPRRPRVPAEVDRPSSEAANAIDAFIVRRLREHGIAKLSPPADRRTLLRRLHFDLTGLPPTPEDVASFATSIDPAEYHRRVDHLLASPAFGERLAAYWLDVVRYADTNGIHGDVHREHWLYRDYVIAAFNQAKPFDQFTVEQLAGDLLPSGGRDQLIASGYNRLNMTTQEGGAQPKEYMAKYSADRVRSVSSTWLGATLGCSECHDHKFDPFTARDFYGLAAFFADIQEIPVGEQIPAPLPTEGQQQQLDALDQQLARARRQLAASSKELADAQASWEAGVVEALRSWREPVIAAATADSGAELARDDAPGPTIFQARGGEEGKDRYTISAPEGVAGATMIRLDCLPDPSLPSQGPGRASNGNFVLSEIELTIGDQPARFQKALAPHSQEGWPIDAAIDGKLETGWAILPGAGLAHHAVFLLEQPATAGPAVVTLRFEHGGQHSLGRFGLAISSTNHARLWLDSKGDIESLGELLAIAKSDRTAEQSEAVAQRFRDLAPELEPLRQEIQRLQGERQRLDDQSPRLLISASVAPREIRILPRGNWLDDSGEVVPPATPAALGALPASDQRATRLDLARWIASPENPATARVLANRLWMLCMGRGIVATPDDFGSQGEWPSHPDLLDWLAMELVDSDWDIKHVMRLILASQAYQQSSDASPELNRLDPNNKLFARQSRYRLDAEAVRDNGLAISGLLIRDVGGPSAKPYQPLGYWGHLNFPPREYQSDTGANQYRRGLYTYWCRTFLHPSMLAFDAPSREEGCVARIRSNTPLSALVLLNDPSYVEAARALAQRALLNQGLVDRRTRIAWMFQQALQRPPSDEEFETLASILSDHLAHYRQQPQHATALLSVGLAQADSRLDPADLAATINVARVIINVHEAIIRY